MSMSSATYALFGRLGRRLEKKLEAFRVVYRSAGFTDPFEAYLSRIIGATLVAAPIFFIAGTLLHLFLLKLSMVYSVIAAIPLTVALSASVFGFLLYYPLYRRYSRRTRIDANIPFTVAYMASLASAGVGIERIVEKSAYVEDNKEIRRELGLILRDIKVLGFDTASAIERAAGRAPSVLLNIFFAGLRDTFITSGDLKNYIMFTARRFISDKMNSLRNVINVLSVMAEIYVTTMVAAPLMFVIILTVMSILGGTLMGLPPVLLIFVLLMLVIPSSAMAVLVVIDGVLSKV